jgi:hypothetical protein
MESGRVTREWLEGLDPAEFQEISALISDIQRERAIARREKLEQRRSAARKKTGTRQMRQERLQEMRQRRASRPLLVPVPAQGERTRTYQ